VSTVIHLDDLQNGYVDLCNFVRSEGHYSKPRGMRTVELEDVTIVIRDLNDTIPTFVNRKPNLMIAALEALQLISGHSTPELLVAASPAFAQFREPDGRFWGAYGTRVRDQVHTVVRKLRGDPDTRQAVITLWDVNLDNDPGRKDYPCTVAMGFRIRNGHLNMSVTMRSNDVWLGVAYDIFQFTQLQFTIANMLGVAIGTYSHHAWSLHMYERDFDLVDQLKLKDDNRKTFIPSGLRDTGHALNILQNRQDMYENSANANIRWYRDLVLKAYEKMANV
jgi:thymidylate synthase